LVTHQREVASERSLNGFTMNGGNKWRNLANIISNAIKLNRNKSLLVIELITNIISRRVWLNTETVICDANVTMLFWQYQHA